MQIVYLDQNKWIALARAVKYPTENRDVRSVLEILCHEAKAGRVAVPLTSTNIYETHKINNSERRHDLAHTQATLSQGLVFRGRHQRLEVEVTDVLRAVWGLEPIERERFWFLSNLFLEAFMEWNDPRFGGSISEKIIQFARRDPPRFLYQYLMETPDDVRIAAVSKFTEGSEALCQNIEQRRKRDADESLSMRRRIQSATLTVNELDLIFSIASKSGIPQTDENEVLHRSARKIINDCPTYYIEREMALRIEAQQDRAIVENDLRDMQAFCAVVGYADIVIAENLFSNLAQQAGLNRKFNTEITTDLLALGDHLQ